MILVQLCFAIERLQFDVAVFSEKCGEIAEFNNAKLIDQKFLICDSTC